MRTVSSAKRMVRTGKMEFMRLYHNPNTRFAMIGILGAFIILGMTFLGLKIFGGEEPVGLSSNGGKKPSNQNVPSCIRHYGMQQRSTKIAINTTGH